jgi:hypothetical protein
MRTKCRRVAIASLTALLLATPLAAQTQRSETPSPPSAATGACPPTTQKFITSDLPVATRSTTPINVRESGLAFVQGGTQGSCVIVSFSAVAAVAQGDVMSVQAVLDGEFSCNPGIIPFQSTPVFTARAMKFVCLLVQPGRHTLRMQFRSANGGLVSLDRRTMIVEHVQ